MLQSILKRLQELPEFLSPTDLVKLGLYKNNNALYFARMRGLSPDYIQFQSRRILYPKEGIIAFIQKHTFSGSIGKHAQEVK